MEIDKIKKRGKKQRVIWLIVTICFAISLCIVYSLSNNDLEKVDHGFLDDPYYYEKAIYIIFKVIFWLLFCFSVFTLIFAFRVRCLHYYVNNIDFCVSVGFVVDYLICDNIIVDSVRALGWYLPPMEYNNDELNVFVRSSAFGNVDFKVNNRVVFNNQHLTLTKEN